MASPEERFYINILDFFDVIYQMSERKKSKINPVVFELGKNYIENLDKKKIIDMFIEASGPSIWDRILKRDIKFCIDYFINYVYNLTKINILSIIDSNDPEALFKELFSSPEEIEVFWEYMRSFVRIGINYILQNEKTSRFETKEMERYQELFKRK
jgi:hypothetical protein